MGPSGSKAATAWCVRYPESPVNTPTLCGDPAARRLWLVAFIIGCNCAVSFSSLTTAETRAIQSPLMVFWAL
jgi:hypothetical protein